MTIEDILNKGDPSGPLAVSKPREDVVDGYIRVRAGAESSLRAEIMWHSIEAATGTLKLFASGHQVWDTPVLQHNDWVRLLERMSAAWDRLSAEEAYPLGATPEKPSELRAFLQGIRSISPSEEVDPIVDRFWSSHNVGSWIFSNSVPLQSLWLMREGLLMIVETPDSVLRISAVEALWALEQVGDSIAKRLRKADSGNLALQDWRRRNDTSPSRLTKLFSTNLGLPDDRADVLIQSGVISIPSKRVEALLGLDEVRAAARMIPLRVSAETMVRICKDIRNAPKGDATIMDAFSREALIELHAFDNSSAREQGIHLARWLRSKIGIADDRRVDPERLLEEWKIPIKRSNMPQLIEAVSFWGPAHGPAITLNPASIHARSIRPKRSRKSAARDHRDLQKFSGPERFTLAHEICHLLIDRQGSLPVAEVFGGSVPGRSEKRASIFASHLLVPLEKTAEIYRGTPTLEECLDVLMNNYGVSISLARYQLWWRARDSNLLRPDDYLQLQRIIESAGR